LGRQQLSLAILPGGAAMIHCEHPDLSKRSTGLRLVRRRKPW
jgi:hypothetical protein